MVKKKIHLLIFNILIIATVVVVGFFILKQTNHAAYVSVLNTANNGKEAESTNYEVESKGDTLNEATEEAIEEDIDQLDVENEQEQEMEKLDDVSNEKLENEVSSPVVIPFKTAVQHTGNKLRIGFITDIHASSEYVDGKWKLQNFFINRINYFLRQMNDNLGPDMIVVDGDIIEGSKVPSYRGMGELRQLKDLFNQTSIKKYWVVGNHDLRSVQKSQWKTALGIDYTQKSFKIKDYKIIILDSNFDTSGNNVLPGNSYTRGNVSEKEISWLKKELASSEKKIVFIHHPPLRGINSTPDIQLIKNANELRDLFSNGNVSAVFSGHIEDLYSEEDSGVKYFVFPGLVKNPNYQGSFVSIDVDGDKITAEMSYIGKDGNYKTIDIEKVETIIK
jgi:Icc-related predicted phosphoesterase